MTNAEKKQFARNLFINTSKTRKEISTLAGCTQKTLRKWIDEGGWESIKESSSITRVKLLDESYSQLAAINEKIRTEHNNVPTKDLSDAKGVIRKEIEALSDHPIYRYVEVFEHYLDWLGENYPSQLRENADRSMEFIQELNTKRK